MNKPIQPSTIAAPAARYALAMSVSAGAQWLHTSGIVGDRPDGTISDDIGEQAAEVWRSINAVLLEVGFATSDIVSYTTYAVVGNALASVMAARDSALQGHLCCSTLVPVPALARPQWKVEIAIVAART
jgi:2-iminobutanoate/2-iminopropanoate deaminase